MIPFQTTTVPCFLNNFVKNAQNGLSAISGIESDSKSVNQNLCESFEGLMKKDEPEESTRSSQWSQQQKYQASASYLTKDVQNQISQKFNGFSEKFGFQSGKICQKVQQSEQIQLESSFIKDQLKKKLMDKRNKLSKYRQKLLAYPCYVKLPQQLIKMVQMSQKIDHYLIEKKVSQYTDNIYNIFKIVFYDEEMSTLWSSVKKLIYIADEHYRIRIDPLKNLCMSFGSKAEAKLQIRKQKLRKLMGQYYFNNKKSYEQKGVPQAFIEPIKTSRFYPQNLSLCPDIDGKKASKKYLDRLAEDARKKQTQMDQIEEKCSSCAPATVSFAFDGVLPDPKQFQVFCDQICKVYTQKNVKHIYKSSLIQNLRKNTATSLQKIFFFIKYISEEQIFLDVMVKSGCTIFGLIQSEKAELVKMLKSRRGE